MSSAHLELFLCLEVEELPIAGTLRKHLTAPQRFDGWLELIAAIEASLSAARCTAAVSPGNPPTGE